MINKLTFAKRSNTLDDITCNSKIKKLVDQGKFKEYHQT